MGMVEGTLVTGGRGCGPAEQLCAQDLASTGRLTMQHVPVSTVHYMLLSCGRILFG